MKKMVLTVVAAMVMTIGYAKTEKTQAVQNNNRYELTFDMRRLAVKLGLTFDQMEAVETIHNIYNDEVAEAANARRFERGALLHEALVKDVRSMRHVLDDKQYDTYMMLLGTTLHNKHLH